MTQHNFRRIGQARRKVSSNAEAETCADATRTSHKSTGPGGPSQVRGVISPALCALRLFVLYGRTELALLTLEDLNGASLYDRPANHIEASLETVKGLGAIA